MEGLVYLVAAIAGGTLLAVGGLYTLGRCLQRREPYRTFLRLRGRQKVSFFRRLLADSRVPWPVKAVPLALIVYLAVPFDLIPDFVPVLGYLDDVALVLAAAALVVRFTPRSVVEELLGDLTRGANPSPCLDS